jgi:hypothetical protein
VFANAISVQNFKLLLRSGSLLHTLLMLCNDAVSNVKVIQHQIRQRTGRDLKGSSPGLCEDVFQNYLHVDRFRKPTILIPICGFPIGMRNSYLPPITMATDCSNTGVAGSDPARGMDVRGFLCCVD